MSFRTSSLVKIMDHTAEAKIEIDKLEAVILANDENNKKTFFSKIANSLKGIDVKDAKEIEYQSEIITEFKSEISSEKIKEMVTEAFQIKVSDMDHSELTLNYDADFIASYTNIMSTVTEASKSSSKVAEDLRFSMDRLSPGVLAFLYAWSVNVDNSRIFGEESVTSTGVYYRLMHSIEDVQNEAAFDALRMDKESLRKMIALQAAILDDLAFGRISFEIWTKLDASYANAARQIRERIAKIESQSRTGKSSGSSVIEGSKINQKIVKTSIEKLSKMGGDIAKIAIQKSKERLSNNHF